jgi:hypothetical protein
MNDDPVLAELGCYTPEGRLTPGYGDHYLFFVGRDDIHGILCHLLKQESLEFDLNMFGYDDEELNQIIMDMFKNPNMHVQISLDRSQASGVHEKKLVALDEEMDTADFDSSFVILQSATHQISHTKGGVLMGQRIWFEGSTNWSDSGEGTGISLKADVANPKGFKSQNNTLLVSTNPTGLLRFKAQLDAEHRIGLQQAMKRKNKEVL